MIGIADNAHYIASDIYALQDLTQQFVYLSDHHTAIIAQDHYQILNQQGTPQIITPQIIKVDQTSSGKDKYEHFMMKEIMEQDVVVSRTLSHWQESHDAQDLKQWDALNQVKHIKIIACGTSYHAGCVARHWFENWAKISCDVEIASEFSL